LAQAVHEQVSPRGVLVRVTARQLCMEMRGPRSTGEVDVVATRGEPGLILSTMMTEQPV
jgi:GTP cyclohydrolase I